MQTAAVPQWSGKGVPPTPKYERVGKEEQPAKETEGRYPENQGNAQSPKLRERNMSQKGRQFSTAVSSQPNC